MQANLRATYRLQLNAEFNFDAAAEVVEYLAQLGVSHIYCSPYLQSAPGSLHGYDVVNYHRISEDLGGSEGHARFSKAVLKQGLGQVFDMVPNHMAITAANPWWWDILEHGPSSRYASYFDIEWNPPESRHKNVVLVPVLGDHYGRVLEAGEIQLKFEHGDFSVRYGDHIFPVDPHSLSDLLTAAAEQVKSDELAFLAGSLERLPFSTYVDRLSAQRRYRDEAVLRGLLRRFCQDTPELEQAIQEVIQEVNGTPDMLDAFLERQNYRLAFWRITQRELGYRRFFDINTMIGLRMEDEQVYIDTHALVLSWMNSGILDGLRIDHPDGLQDPEKYFGWLAEDQPEAWIVIEKILAENERLPSSWPVAGTTGYDFLNRVNGLFVDPSSEQALTDFYQSFTGLTVDFPELVRQKKILAALDVLGSDLNRLAELFLRVLERHRRYRDYVRFEALETLREVSAALPVYRTYVRPEVNQVTDEDRGSINAAVETVKALRPDLDPDLIDFFRDLLLLKVRGDLEDELVLLFQQFTGPVMAKGVEDTSFYIYNRFVSLNEVGGNPYRFGVSPAAFHRGCEDIQRHWPRTMLSTSTHDTKRSEDIRARLNVLSEIPQRWAEAVLSWSEMNDRHRVEGHPDRNDEYLLYQTLVGAWPIEPERVLQYMEKAVREARVHSSWTDPDAGYEQAVASFIRGIMGDEQFTGSLAGFVSQIVEPGRINSLSQTLLKLTAPGIPDLYQGTELWNFSLVDPDNRRPVDYEQRQRLLAEMQNLNPDQIWSRVDDGLPKLWVICQALALRQRNPAAFNPAASYRPLAVEGAENALAYLRGNDAAVIVPRFVLKNRRDWDSAVVELPAGRWVNELTGELLDGGKVSLASLFERFPVSLLSRDAVNP